MNWIQRAHLSQLSRPLAFKRAPAHRPPCSPWPANSPHRARSRVLREAGGAQVAAKVAGWRDTELQPRALEEGVARVVDGFERPVGQAGDRRREVLVRLAADRGADARAEGDAAVDEGGDGGERDGQRA